MKTVWIEYGWDYGPEGSERYVVNVWESKEAAFKAGVFYSDLDEREVKE